MAVVAAKGGQRASKRGPGLARRNQAKNESSSGPHDATITVSLIRVVRGRQQFESGCKSVARATGVGDGMDPEGDRCWAAAGD
ncbi:hypothetical protein NEUTE2DRAFT_52549 [Neurospora tetrasperma FGSC 2509]|nr:hypothetical protein NEUTE2DRAFT_52549 [Neurospora tetrasperma FGSC 2509]